MDRTIHIISGMSIPCEGGGGRAHIQLPLKIPQTDLSVGVLTVLVLPALDGLWLRRWWSRTILHCHLQYLVTPTLKKPLRLKN